MIRYYCDVCSVEINRNYVTQRFQPEWEGPAGRWRATVHVSMDSTWNKGDICKNCLMGILMSTQEWK